MAVLPGICWASGRLFGPVFGHLLLAVVDIAAGVFALAWPAPTVLTYSVTQIAAGIQLRSAGQDVGTILGRAA